MAPHTDTVLHCSAYCSAGSCTLTVRNQKMLLLFYSAFLHMLFIFITCNCSKNQLLFLQDHNITTWGKIFISLQLVCQKEQNLGWAGDSGEWIEEVGRQWGWWRRCLSIAGSSGRWRVNKADWTHYFKALRRCVQCRRMTISANTLHTKTPGLGVRTIVPSYYRIGR